MGENGNNPIMIEYPDKCIGCGWVAPKADPDVELEIGSQWLVIAIPDSVVWLHVCPKCGIAMGNKNAVENVKKLQELKNRRIIEAKGEFLPPRLPNGLISMN